MAVLLALPKSAERLCNERILTRKIGTNWASRIRMNSVKQSKQLAITPEPSLPQEESNKSKSQNRESEVKKGGGQRLDKKKVEEKG